ncbi:MAG TPA: tetratricopeptide repeat protein [Terriglobia bacterium]|nr:tetratricopeptide repeat protein [Terriglobia bacterium]HEX5482097.1 tetratricopeptide repeat protein [Terriglobia bacterium]
MRRELLAAILVLTWAGAVSIAAAGFRQPSTAELCDHALAQPDPGNDAVRACRELRQSPSNPKALNDLGVFLARRKMYSEAVATYHLALAAGSGLPQVETNLGIAYFRMGDFKRAAPVLRQALRRRPSNLQTRTLLGMSLYGMRNYAGAGNELAKVAAAQPQNVKLQFVLAECYLLSHQSEKTLQAFQKIEQEEPNSAEAYMLFGQALDGLGRYVQATEEFQKAAAAAPDAPNVHFVLGYLYWKQRKFDPAAAEFQKDLARNPGNGESRAYLGDISYRHGDLHNARQLLEKARQEGVRIRLLYLDLGIIDTDQKRYGAAVAELRKAVALDPTQTDTHYRLALAYKGLGNADAAKQELQTIKEMREENHNLAQQEVQQGQHSAH